MTQDQQADLIALLVVGLPFLVIIWTILIVVVRRVLKEFW